MGAPLLDAVGGALEVTLGELLRLRLIQEIQLATPAAGVDPSSGPTSNAVWELIALEATLTTSAVVANRRPSLLITDQNNRIVQRFENPNTQAASLAVPYTWLGGYSSPIVGAGNDLVLPDPAAVILPGRRLAFSTQNLDAGDAWTNLTITVREWTFDELVRQTEWLGRHLAT